MGRTYPAPKPLSPSVSHQPGLRSLGSSPEVGPTKLGNWFAHRLRAALRPISGECHFWAFALSIEELASTSRSSEPFAHMGERAPSSSLCQRVGPELEVHGAGLAPLAAFHQPWGPIPARRPQPTAFPAGV